MKATLLLFSIALFSASMYAAQEAEQNNKNPENLVRAIAPKPQNIRGLHDHIFTQENPGPKPVYDDTGTYLYSILYTPERRDGQFFFKPSISF